MPTYDYRCEANGKVYEVKHPMAVTVSTWGELRALADVADDNVADDTAVTRLLSIGGGIVKSSSLKNPEAPACMSGGCGGGGRCQFE